MKESVGNWRRGSVDFLSECSLETFASSRCRCYFVYLNSSRLLIVVSARLTRFSLSFLSAEHVLCFWIALRSSIHELSSFFFGTHEELNRNGRREEKKKKRREVIREPTNTAVMTSYGIFHAFHRKVKRRGATTEIVATYRCDRNSAMDKRWKGKRMTLSFIRGTWHYLSRLV